MKRRAAVVASPAQPPAQPPAVGVEPARQQLRDFAAFLETQDPEALAAEVTQIDDTLMRAAQVQGWFRKYIAALKSRVVH